MPSNSIVLISWMMLINLSGIYYQKIFGQTKRALLIGISNYPQEGGWANLSSKNDLKLIENTLIERGFQSENIVEVLDEKATHDGILDELNTRFLNKISANDIVYVHFSGHGQQKQDFNGDETDGLDECLVPYDSPKKFQKGVYEGQKLITDDEFGKSLTAMRQKLGSNGQLFVVLDACHSGTGTRGISLARGTTEVMADPDFLKNNLKNSSKLENNDIPQSTTSSKDLSPMISFFGSAQNQLNYEMTTEGGEHYGSLSFALAKYLSKAKPEESYRGLFESIRLEMSSIAPLQNPQCEGQLDMEIANGRLLSKPNYYKVSKIISDSIVIIKAGELHGLLKGSEISLYPPESRDLSRSTVLTTGTIIKCYPSESEIKLDKVLAPSVLNSAWIFVTQKSMGDQIVKIGFNISNANLASQLENILLSKKFIKKDQQAPDLWIKFSESNSSIVVNSKEGYELETISYQESQLESALNKVINSIKTYLQGELMRKMEFDGSDIKVSFKIIPIENLTNESELDQIKPLQMDDSGAKKLSISSKIKLLIINEGIKPAYFTVIDLQPDNKYTVIIPGPQSTAEEMRILPDQKILFPISFTIGAPAGTEIFKLISSDKPIDLRPSVGTRGISKNPMEKLFLDSPDERNTNTRGINDSKISITDISIYSDTFIITNSSK